MKNRYLPSGDSEGNSPFSPMSFGVDQLPVSSLKLMCIGPNFLGPAGLKIT